MKRTAIYLKTVSHIIVRLIRFQYRMWLPVTIVLLTISNLSLGQVNCSSGPCFLSPCAETYPNPCFQAASATLVNNYMNFAWEDCCNPSTYELQILKLYNIYSSTSSVENDITAKIDWSSAHSIVTNIGSKFQNWVILAEGTGYYVWRVRRIRNTQAGKITGHSDNWGLWTDHGPYTDGATVHITPSSATQPYILFYNQFNDSLNWIFNRTYGHFTPYFLRTRKLAENMTFANYLLMPVQEQYKNQFDGVVLGSQIIPDNLGRPSFKTMFAPIRISERDGESFGYKYDFTQNSANTLYKPDDYDDEAHAMSPSIIGNGSLISQYYSDQNTGEPLIPDARGRAFSRTLYQNNGLNRPKEIAEPGAVHQLGNHSVKKYYGSTSSGELIHIFGDEAPEGNKVLKTVTVDPNDVISVAYTDENERLLATCLSAPHSSLLTPIQGNTPVTVYDTLSKTKTAISSTKLMGTTGTYTFAVPTTLDYIYKLIPNIYGDTCFSLCATCDYKVTIICHNTEEEDTLKDDVFVLTASPVIDSVNGNCTGTQYTLGPTVFHYPAGSSGGTLPPGTYTVSYFITLNNSDPISGTPYVDIIAASLRRKIKATLNNPSLTCQVLSPGGNQTASLSTIQTYLDNNNIWDLLITYLKVDTTKPEFRLKIGCDTVTLPTAYCDRPSCSPVTFAKYMVDYLTQYDIDHQSNFYASATAGTTGLALTTSALHGFVIQTNTEINSIIQNMLNEVDGGGKPVYTCSELWSAWKITVQNYATEQVNLAGGLTLQNAVKSDWWFDFMNRVKYKIKMEVRDPTNYLTNSNHDLRKYPYKYFPYLWGDEPALEVAFCGLYTVPITCTTSLSAPVWYTDPVQGLMGPTRNFPGADPQLINFHIYNFFIATKFNNLPFGNLPPPSPGSATTPEEVYAQANADCYRTCDNRIDEAVSEIIQSYNGKLISVEGYNYPTYLSPAVGSRTLETVYCMATAVIEQCKKSCNLPTTSFADFNNAMMGVMDVEIKPLADGFPTPQCDPGFIDVPKILAGKFPRNKPWLEWLDKEHQRILDSLQTAGATQTFTWANAFNSFSSVVGIGGTACTSPPTNISIDPNATEGWFSYGAMTNTPQSISSANITIVRKTPSLVLPGNLVYVEVEATLGNGLATGEKIKFIEDAPTPTSPLTPAEVPASLGVIVNTPSIHYEYTISGPKSAGAKIIFSYYYIVNGASGVNMNYNGHVDYTNANNVTVSSTTSTSPSIIGCTPTIQVPLVYNSLVNGVQSLSVICDDICTETQDCGRDSICLRWIEIGTVPPGDTIYPITCEQFLSGEFETALKTGIQDIYDRHDAKIRAAYAYRCLDPQKINDLLRTSYIIDQYQYTLYYYDRAGNLIRTVSPAGVIPGSTNRVTNPQHTYASQSDYNTLGQVIRSSTPDAGFTAYWYDKIGRLRFSRNSKQSPLNEFSYVKYDPLGRIVETGEANSTALDVNVDDNTFPSSGTKQVTRTTYSVAYSGLVAGAQTHFYNRVSFTETDQDGNWTTVSDRARTIYSYDPKGNVNKLYQWAAGMPEHKVLNYNYSQIDGLVNSVELLKENGTPDLKDHFMNIILYNADSRLISTHLTCVGFPSYTQFGTPSPGMDFDIQYHYYQHGYLRTRKYGLPNGSSSWRQSMDFTYTLEGWLKGMNHSSGDTADDPGHDGSNGNVPDAWGTILNYYDGDFQRNSPAGSKFISQPSNPRYYRPDVGLYNGTITSWQQRIASSNTAALVDERESGYKYRYDELYRLTEGDYATKRAPSYQVWAPNNSYDESFQYDKNSNIRALQRYASVAGAPQLIDNFGYFYTPNTNRLASVNDAANNNYNFTGTSFGYDATGNVTSDATQGETMTWNAANKLLTVTKTGMSAGNLYDAMGNVVRKTVTTSGATVTNWYIRDGEGNTIAVYEQSAATGNTFKVIERYVYADERLEVLKGENTTSGTSIVSLPKRVFILNDHLGNERVQLDESSTPTNIVMNNYTNYYAFGAAQPFRTYNNALARHGFNTQEKREEIKSGGLHYNARYWEYDAVYGRRWNLDSKPVAWESSYSINGNNPIRNIDRLGESWEPIGKNGKPVNLTDKENIFGYRWVEYDVDKSGKKIAKANTVETAYLFGNLGMTTLSSEGYREHRTWQPYEDITTGDEGTDKKIASLHPDIQDQMKSLILLTTLRFGIDLRITSGFRSYQEQDKLYAQGRTTPGQVVTKARGGFSNHNFGLAVDVVPFENGKPDWNTNLYPLIGRLGKSRGLEWGGEWKSFTDLPHFQNLFGNSLKELRGMQKDKSGLPMFKTRALQ